MSFASRSKTKTIAPVTSNVYVSTVYELVTCTSAKQKLLSLRCWALVDKHETKENGMIDGLVVMTEKISKSHLVKLKGLTPALGDNGASRCCSARLYYERIRPITPLIHNQNS